MAVCQLLRIFMAAFANFAKGAATHGSRTLTTVPDYGGAR